MRGVHASPQCFIRDAVHVMNATDLVVAKQLLYLFRRSRLRRLRREAGTETWIRPVGPSADFGRFVFGREYSDDVPTQVFRRVFSCAISWIWKYTKS